ncbi:MAG: glycoside hydrolase family 44 protein [Chloroflexota bacterium]
MRRSNPSTILRSFAGQANLVIFDDELNLDHWSDLSYDTELERVTSPVFTGKQALKVTHSAAYSSFFMQSPYLIPAESIQFLTFNIYGGGTAHQWIKIRLANEDGEWVFGILHEIKPNRWQTVELPMASFGEIDQVRAIIVQNAADEPLESYYIDDFKLVFGDENSGSEEDGVYELQVDASTVTHAISPLIYGVNLVDERMGDELNVSVSRYGGNSTSRYNWKNNAANLGHDWYFMSVPRDGDESTLPHGSETDRFVEQNIRTQTQTIMTLPLMGWAAKDREVRCGFSVEKYGEQEETEYWHPDCGNGVLLEKENENGYILDADPTDASMPIDEQFVQEWLEHLTSKYGTAADGGVQFYSMDNEPMLWSHNHRDVHPEHTTYDEVRDKTYLYASVVKQTDPSAQVIGPAVFGWPAYFYSALDLKHPEGHVDRLAHGDIPFLEWYLQQMAAYEADTGTRILDVLDIHYYPQAEGVSLNPVGDQATQQRRLRTTRSLWDPDYADESWIREPVMLIPRMHEWVDSNYPDTKRSISEYNFGGLEHVNGAVAQADVLGIFGRENLHMATLWGWRNINADQPWAYTFRMFRNYDGQKSTFGDKSVVATSENEWDVSVFAARRTEDDALTIMIINKRFELADIELNLDGVADARFADVYQYSADDLHRIQSLGSERILHDQASLSLPSQSITLLVFEDVSYTDPPPEPTPTLKPTPTPSPADDPLPHAPVNPTPVAEPKFRQTVNHQQSAEIEYQWLKVEVPANTFAEDVYFDISLAEHLRHPAVDLDDLLLSNQPIDFEMAAYSTASGRSVDLSPGRILTVDLQMAQETAERLATGSITLLQWDPTDREWGTAEVAYDASKPTNVSFSVSQLSSWNMQDSQRKLFLPMIRR